VGSLAESTVEHMASTSRCMDPFNSIFRSLLSGASLTLKYKRTRSVPAVHRLYLRQLVEASTSCLYLSWLSSYATLCQFFNHFAFTMSDFMSSKSLKAPVVSERSCHSSPSLAPTDEKDLKTPSSSTFSLESQVPSPPPYHVFSRSRKLQMVCIVSLAAIFSPLSSNIYFPALGVISRVSQLYIRLAISHPNIKLTIK